MTWKVSQVQSMTDGYGFVVQNGPQLVSFVYSDEVTANHWAKLVAEAVEKVVQISVHK